ncbi:hypothetical protein ACF06V_15625 [Streptomyces bobili]|uniref:hypothetical protein n=1 Tax=Streptomyces bobili TaxID=67280 RepID=UPI0036F9EB39
MDRGLAVPTARVRCGSGTVGTPPAGPALPTAARGSPLRLTGLGFDLRFACDFGPGFGFGFGFVSVAIASTTWLVRLRLVRRRLAGTWPVRLRLVWRRLVRRRLVRRLPVRIRPVRVGLVRVGLIRA